MCEAHTQRVYRPLKAELELRGDVIQKCGDSLTVPRTLRIIWVYRCRGQPDRERPATPGPTSPTLVLLRAGLAHAGSKPVEL